MAHVLLPSGRDLRLRLHPKPKSVVRARAPDAAQPLALFGAPAQDDTQDTAQERLAARISTLALLNRINATILERAPELGLRDWWLVSGSIFQTVWNLKDGRPAERGIKDYDLFYFSEDLSEEAEEGVIAAARGLFADLPADLRAGIRVRNQARVHLWYPQEIGQAYPPLTTAAEGILRLPCSPQVVGLKRTGSEFLDVYAPFGLGDIWDMIVRPNRAMPLMAVYDAKCTRWQQEWPRLQVYGWDDGKRPKLRVVQAV